MKFIGCCWYSIEWRRDYESANFIALGFAHACRMIFVWGFVSVRIVYQASHCPGPINGANPIEVCTIACLSSTSTEQLCHKVEVATTDSAAQMLSTQKSKDSFRILSLGTSHANDISEARCQAACSENRRL